MKERLILFCMLLLCGIGVSRAQSGNAKDFDQKEEAIVQKLQQAVNEKNYKEAEKNGKALITLFKEQDENTQKKYSWLIQSYYYNLACFQSLLKKKGEAIVSMFFIFDNSSPAPATLSNLKYWRTSTKYLLLGLMCSKRGSVSGRSLWVYPGVF